MVWVYDVKRRKSRQTSVERICYQEFLYDQIKPSETEAELKALEDHYGRIIALFFSNSPITKQDVYYLYLFAILLHVRNPSFSNLNIRTRIENVRDAFKTTLVNFNSADIYKYFDNWEFGLLHSESGAYLTSDHPCIYYRDLEIMAHDSAIPRLIVFPVCPSTAFIFVRKPWKIIKNSASAADMGVLLGAISQQRIQYLISYSDLATELQGEIDNTIPDEDRGFFKDATMRTNHHVMEEVFSFLSPFM